MFPGELVILTNNMINRRILLSFILLFFTFFSIRAQNYCGMEGMIFVPTADMDTVGVARAGFQFVPKKMVPDAMKHDGKKYNTLTNYLSFTPFRWVEVGYGYTLMKMFKNHDRKQGSGFYSKDRYFSLKIQPIVEDRWWPSVALGGNDVIGASDGGKSGSNYYRNYFIVMSKHTEQYGLRIGGHLAYRYWKRSENHRWNGLVGGVTVQHSVYKPLRVMAEWDGNSFNIGTDCLLFNCVLIQCGLYDMSNFTGGLSLYIHLL